MEIQDNLLNNTCIREFEDGVILLRHILEYFLLVTVDPNLSNMDGKWISEAATNYNRESPIMAKDAIYPHC